MKKIVLFLIVGLCMIGIAAAQEVGCCVEEGVCYKTSSSQLCNGEIYDSCDGQGCFVVKECIPGEAAACVIQSYPGEKTCNVNNQYGPCLVVDQQILLSIDSDGDGDPDSTDCSPDDPTISYTNQGCVLGPGDLTGQAYLGPVGKGALRIMLVVVLAFIAVLLYMYYGLNSQEKNMHHKKNKKK